MRKLTWLTDSSCADPKKRGLKENTSCINRSWRCHNHESKLKLPAALINRFSQGLLNFMLRNSAIQWCLCNPVSIKSRCVRFVSIKLHVWLLFFPRVVRVTQLLGLTGSHCLSKKQVARFPSGSVEVFIVRLLFLNTSRLLFASPNELPALIDVPLTIPTFVSQPTRL